MSDDERLALVRKRVGIEYQDPEKLRRERSGNRGMVAHLNAQTRREQQQEPSP